LVTVPGLRNPRRPENEAISIACELVINKTHGL
jgi:hypothetical protein